LLLDTSVYLNVLDVPRWNQDRDEVLEQFGRCIEDGDYFLLPMATIWETGNHIADLETGGYRRRYAVDLVDDVTKAIKGDAPYAPTHFPEQQEFLDWLRAFPDYAQRSKSENKQREGVSLSDLSIIKEWERARAQHAMTRVRVWSLDADLQAYDTGSA
jgi:hypothetical protein